MRYEIYWVSADGSEHSGGSIEAGDISLDLMADILREELMAQCGDADEIEVLESGSFSVREIRRRMKRH